MDEQVEYYNFKTFRGFAHKRSSSPSFLQGICHDLDWHKCGLKLGCIVIVLLALTVVGLSVSVIFLQRTSSIGKSDVCVQENKKETTERSFLLRCTEPWTPSQGKCLFFSTNSDSWNKSQDDCCRKGSSLLLIQDQEEVRHIQNQINYTGNKYWIGLKFISEGWEWLNGSSLNDNILQIEGDPTENSCVSISAKKLVSETCQAETKWICQKIPTLIRNKVCSDS